MRLRFLPHLQIFFALIGLSVSLIGCGGVRYTHEGISYSPLANTSRYASPDAVTDTKSSASIRRDAVAFARKRLETASWKTDFGQTDIADLFAALKARVDWSKDNPLSDLIRAAERRKAFSAADLPRPGDIVLFHNQTDRNGNKTDDDWLTGCGIVTDTKDKTFNALVRTGRGPRSVVVTPGTPSVRVRTGRVINSFLRVPSPADPTDAEYLAGQLYAGRIDIDRLLSR